MKTQNGRTKNIIITIVIAAVLLCVILLAVLPTVPRAHGSYRLTVFFTGDLHGQVDNLPYYYTIIQQARHDGENVLLLDCGDLSYGGPRQEKGGVPVVALVGYTNAGKSTLFNRLTGADVYVQNQLFATLDAVSRRVETPTGMPFLLVDTVGFIRKLPHSLVSAFRSTLEEAALADVLVIVSDGASPDMESQHRVVEEVLAELGATEQPRIEAVNKCDLGGAVPPGAVRISAQTGEGLDRLMDEIARQLQQTHAPVTLMIPFSRYGLLSQVRPLGQVLEEKHTDTGTELTLLLSSADRDRLLSKYGAELFVTHR